MRVQRVEMFVSPMATPADTSGLQKLADSGKIKPDTLVALVGKTEGTGFHDDWGRVWADVALRDRRMLSADGIFIVVVTVAEQDGRSVADPEVILRGVPFLDEANELREEIRAEVEATLARAAREQVREVDLLQRMLHDDLAALVYERLRRRPMVLPVVVEV